MRRQYDIWFHDTKKMRDVCFDDIKKIEFLETGAVRISDGNGFATIMAANEFDELEVEINEDDS